MKYNTNATRRKKQNSNRQKRNDAYTTARRDSSADWRTEYEDVHVDPRGHELHSDGGTRFVLPSEGTIVYDDAGSYGVGDELFILNIHPETSANEVYIDELGQTVASVNDEYADSAPVADCVYLDELVNVLGDWDSVGGVRTAVADGEVRSYTFPVDRLAATRGGEGE
jgi:hypothetical protein